MNSIYSRRSPRLDGFDYSEERSYFITVCVEQRQCLFGDVTLEGGLVLNSAGNMVNKWWQELENKFKGVELDGHVVMPNHFHGILVLAGTQDDTPPKASFVGADLRVRPALPVIMQWFKTMTTNAYIRGVKQEEWMPFPARLWQRSYHDHIIRSERSLNALRHYVENNPVRWVFDRENPVYVRN